MNLTPELNKNLVNAGSSLLLFLLAVALAWIAERYRIWPLLFFVGWFARSAVIRDGRDWFFNKKFHELQPKEDAS